MKRILCLSALLAVSCSNPVAPTSEPIKKIDIPSWHGMPFDWNGKTFYLCATQPRAYSTGMEVDRYVSETPCPSIPIE